MTHPKTNNTHFMQTNLIVQQELFTTLSGLGKYWNGWMCSLLREQACTMSELITMNEWILTTKVGRVHLCSVVAITITCEHVTRTKLFLNKMFDHRNPCLITNLIRNIKVTMVKANTTKFSRYWEKNVLEPKLKKDFLAHEF